MRMLLGMILGALLTVLAAYGYDSSQARGETATARPMVNWDVVEDNWRGVKTNLRNMADRVHDEWVKRSG